MSIPTLQGLQTALSGLVAEQTALDTAGNNIANANTEGYSRETALMEPNPPIPIPAISAQTGEGAQLGAGVTVATITRIRNGYLDSQYRTQNSSLGAATADAEVLERAQAAFNEPSSAGIATQLSKFWSAWNSLAESPSSKPAKDEVVAAGEQLSTTFNELSSQLSTFATQAGEEYNSLTGPSGEVEDYANQIAQLNGQIKLAEEAGQPPNDMLDRRDLLLDKLSALANITVTEEPDHTDTVTFGEAAKPLVKGTTVNWPQALTESSGGRLGALIQLTGPNGALSALQAQLDEVAGTLSSTVNGYLAKPFFSGATAATLAVAVTAGEVQASGTGAPGGNEVAQKIAALRGGAAEQQYAGLVEKVGSDVRTAQDNKTNLQTTVTAISDQRQSVSGVSLDEEMTNLITYQRGYQASARTLTAMSEMLETLIEHTGVVGL
jgi:flagellar hook-associated protein 1